MYRSRQATKNRSPFLTHIMTWGPPTALWFGLCSQIIWMASDRSPDTVGLYNVAAVIGFCLLAFTRGRNQIVVTVTRLFLAFAFLGSVADRFGLFGGAGTPGVSWGSWSAFVDYTEDVNAFLPHAMAPVLAIIATTLETILGLGVAIGKWRRQAATAAALLLTVFGIAMTISLGAGSTFEYSVWLLAGGSWLISTTDAFPRSIRQPFAWRPGTRVHEIANTRT